MSCWTCTCPDFERRQKVCKHCLFILSRVLKFDVNLVFPDQKVDAGRQQRSIEHRILLLQYRASQDSKDQKETNEIRFEVLGHSGSIYEVLYVAESKQSGYVGSKLQMQQKLQTDKDLTLSITKWNQELADSKKKEQGVAQRPYVDQECPICFEGMTAKCDLVFCYETCGNSMHKVCLQRYVKVQKKSICPFCRSDLIVSKVPKTTPLSKVLS